MPPISQGESCGVYDVICCIFLARRILEAKQGEKEGENKSQCSKSWVNILSLTYSQRSEGMRHTYSEYASKNRPIYRWICGIQDVGVSGEHLSRCMTDISCSE